MKDDLCKQDVHCWEPIIIFSSMIYIRRCVCCGLWKFRNKLEENNDYWMKKLKL